MEIATVVGGVTGLVNAVAIILVNGKVDRLTGRVDVLQEAVMKAVVNGRGTLARRNTSAPTAYRTVQTL